MLTICEPVKNVGRNVTGGTLKILTWIKTGTVSLSRTLIRVAKTMKDAVSNCGALCGEDELEFKRINLEKKQEELFARLGRGISPKALPSIGSEDEKVKKLIEDVQKSEKEVQEVREAISLRRQNREIAVLIKRAESDLKNPDAKKRRTAVRVLERIGRTDVIPALTGVLQDSDPEIRSSAARIIRNLVDGQTVPDQKSDSDTPAQPVAGKENDK